MVELTLGQARAEWARRQFAETNPLRVPGGWIRALGGVDPYLALKARCPDLERATVDEGLTHDRLWVVPGVRGCIWLVPAHDVSLALRTGDAQARPRLEREMRKIGVEHDELTAVREAALAALAEGPLTTDALREALGDTVRSLGAAGKKYGHSTTLPPALRLLEGEGRVRRLQDRLDTNRYAWGLTTVNPFELGPAPIDPAERARALADRFFRWAGPATLSEFVGWSALGKRISRAALAALELVEVKVEGFEEPAFVHAFEADALLGASDPTVRLLPGLDNLLTLRGRQSVLADAAHHDVELLGMGKRTVKLRDSTWLTQRPIVRGGEWIGLWDYDPDGGEVVTGTFAAVDAATRARIADAAETTRAFFAGPLEGRGHAHSIDAEKHQRRRAEAVRGMAG